MGLPYWMEMKSVCLDAVVVQLKGRLADIGTQFTYGDGGTRPMPISYDVL